MSTPNDGGNAFPSPSTENWQGSEGMSLRDWYIGQAMKGLLSNPRITEHLIDLGKERFRAIAVDAEAYADAALAERAKENT